MAVCLSRRISAPLLAALLFCMFPVAAQQPTVMKLATATINDIQHDWLKRFAAEVEKASAGRIKSEIYPASQLGSIPRQIEGTQFGSIQAWAGPPQFLTGLDSRFEILSSPGIFKDTAHASRVINDPAFAKAFLGLGANKGLVGIGLFMHGPAGIVTRTKSTKLADLEGKKIRVLASPMEVEPMRRLKATPVPMSLGEVLPALQQGAIDGAMSPITVFSTMRFYDAAKYFLGTEHAQIAGITVVSKTWLDKLPADLQKIIVDAGQSVSANTLPVTLTMTKDHSEAWQKAGGEITALSDADRTQLRTLFGPLAAEITAKKPDEKAMFELLAATAKRLE